MRLVRAALHNPYWVIVFTLIIAILGGVCAVLLPKDILPTFKTSAVQVVTFYPGMPAEVMEKDITSRLERWTGQSNGIARQESKSMVGVSIVKDFFRPDIDPNTAMSQVTSFAMSDLFYLPPGTIPPMVMPFDPTASVPLALLTVQNPAMDETKLYDIAYFDLRNMLQGISGVIAPAVYGGKLRRILAYVDPRRLAERSLSSLDVIQALKESNVLIPTGDAKLGDKDVQIVTNAMVPKVEDMNNFLVRAREGVDIKVGDVAHVEDSHQIQTNVARVNGRRQVYIPIYRQPGANTIQVIDGIRQALQLILERLPQGIQLDIAADQSIFVRRAIRSLTQEVAAGGLLSALIVLVFLRNWRSSTVVFAAIPISILACFLGLYATGDSLNAMTLGGVALAVGRLIDDAIVVLENITRYFEQGASGGQAALEATGEVAMPVLAATVTTVIVFLPVAFLTGIGKFLFTPLAKAVAFSIGASYLVAMTIIPIFCARFLRAEGHRPSPYALSRAHAGEGDPDGRPSDRRGEGEGTWSYRLLRNYQTFLRRCLAVRGRLMSIALLAFVASLLLYPLIGKELFPAADVGHLTLHVRMPTGTRIELTEKMADDIEKHLTDVIEPEALKIVITNIGVLNDWPAAYTPNSGPGDMFFELELSDQRRYSAQEYARRLRAYFKEHYPAVELAVDTGGLLTAALNQGLASPINIQITGSNLQTSGTIAQALASKIQSVPGAVDVRVQERLDYPQIEIDLDRPRIAELGLTVEEVVKNVVAALNSSINFSPAFWIDPKNGNHYFLGVQYPEEAIKDLDTLRRIAITGKHQERVVQLQEIATFKELTASSEVRHLNIARVIDIFANVQGRDIGHVAADIEKMLPKPQELPEGVRVAMRGEVASMREAFQNLGYGLLLSVVLLYLVLAGQFRSFADPLLILVAVPLGLMGVLATLWVTHTALNVQSFIGIIFMVGIAVSNSILLIEFANRELEAGKSADEAVMSAAGIRLRPILMTSIATVLGLLPMAIGIGHGSEANVPLGRAVLGGILVSTMLTLVVVPMLYSTLQRLKGHSQASAGLIGALLAVLLLPATGRAYSPLSFQEAVAIALDHNPELKSEEARLKEAEEDVHVARSGAYPRLTLDAMDSAGLGGSSAAIGITGLVNSPYRKGPAVGVDTAWNIYDFGRTAYRTEAAQKRLELAKARLRRMNDAIRLRIVETYFPCARTQTLLAVFPAWLKDQDRLVQEIGRYMRSGLRSPVEFDLIRATREGVLVRQVDVQAQAAIAQSNLAEGLGREAGAFECQADLSAFSFPAMREEDLVSQALNRRPEIIEAHYEVDAAHADLKVANRETGPVLSAVGSGGLLSETSLVEKKEWSAGVGLRMPFFEGFRLTAQENRAASAQRESENRLLVVRLAITREVRNAYAQARGIQERAAHLTEQERFTETAYHLALRRYLDKTGSFTDLRDAQAAYFQASEQSIDATFDQYQSVEQLKVLTGL